MILFKPSPLRLLCFILLLFLLGGCLSSQSAVRQEDKAMVPEPVDAACSYFYYSWGRTAELEGHLLEAQEAYSKALVCDENSEFLRRQLVHLLIAMGKKEKAAVMLESMVQGHDVSNKTRIEMAGIFENLGKTESAIALLKESLEEDPDDAQSLLTLGYLHFRHEQLEEARIVLEEYVELEPDSYSGAVMLAKLYRAMEEKELAAAMYDKVLELNWSMVQALDAASFFESMGDVERAMDIYERLLENGEVTASIRRRLVTLYLVNGKNDKAMAQLEIMRADSLHPDRVDLAIGRVLLEQRRFTAAITHFVKMVAAYPGVEIVRPLLALAYHEIGDDDSARKVLAQVPVDSSEFQDAILMSVRLYQDGGQLDKGISFLQKVVDDAERRRETFYFVLADLYLKSGKKDKGAAIFAEGHKIFPDSSRLLFEYGLYMEKIGRPDDAMIYMEKVLDIDGDDALALNYIGYTWADQGIKLNQALDYVSRSVKARPDDGFVRDSLGWVYYKMGNYERAAIELFEAVSMQPDDPTINEHLGDAYVKTGATKKAVEA